MKNPASHLLSQLLKLMDTLLRFFKCCLFLRRVPLGINAMNKIFFIVNPVGGKGKVRELWPGVKEKLYQAGVSLEFAETQRPMHAAELAAEAVASGFRQIIAVGGDGTLNELVNGLMRQTVCAPDEVGVSILPLGTGNDWVRTQQIPTKTNAWIKRLLAAKEPRTQDVGLAAYTDETGTERQRYFVNVAGMAYDAFVVREIEMEGKKSANALLYLLMLFRLLRDYTPYLHRLELTLPGEAEKRCIEKEIHTLNIGICRYSGGGMQLVPHADPDDGLLALTLVEKLSKFEIILHLRDLYNGKLIRHPKAIAEQVSSLKVESADRKPLLLEVDGEFVASCASVSFSIGDSKLKLLI